MCYSVVQICLHDAYIYLFTSNYSKFYCVCMTYITKKSVNLSEAYYTVYVEHGIKWFRS